MLHQSPHLAIMMNPVPRALKHLCRFGYTRLFIAAQRHLYGTHDSISAEDNRQAEIATKFRLEVADRTNIALVQEDRRADARHDGTDSKRSRPFGSDNTLRTMLALMREFVAVNRGIGRNRYVDRDTADCGRRPCYNLGISMDAQYVDIDRISRNLELD